MSKSAKNLSCLFIVLAILGIVGCAGGTRGNLKRVQQPTETELKQDWRNYTVYYRRNLAFVYKIKNDQEIILDKRWVKISSEDMMAKSKILDSTWVKEIIGNNGEMLGYLVHRYHDLANVKIIDENTVQLYYRYVSTSGR
ncbi:MAG: hypothetical protein HKO68_20730 [Desulfobacterales bacterium]|nr:hypothetical protein [Desulfobacterales bacterium]